jgi:hypothetical protein
MSVTEPRRSVHDGIKLVETVVVSNIANELRSADLRAFFSEWVEANRFVCFHYQHREDTSQKTAGEGPKTRCCLVKMRSQQDAILFIKRYDGVRWLHTVRVGGELELSSACMLRLARTEDLCPTTTPRHANTDGEQPEAPAYQTRKQKRANARKGLLQTRETLVPKDLLPPPGLPQGNVGTPSKRLVELVSACVVPPAILKGLGVQLSSCSRSRQRQGEFNFVWGFKGDGDDMEDDIEEWDRYEAIHGPIPTHTHERADRLECDYYLFEENCEQTWEKGSSGLVFHTDDAHWDAAQGDFHERTADALDVAPGDEDAECDWDAGTRDPDAHAHSEELERRQELDKLARMRACRDVRPWRPRRLEVPGLPPALHLARHRGQASHGLEMLKGYEVRKGTAPRQTDTGSEKAGRGLDGEDAGKIISKEPGFEDAFERDVRRGFAGKLCEKMGWKSGEGLGVRRDLGLVKGLASTWLSVGSAGMAVVKSLREARRGIGFSIGSGGAGADELAGSDVDGSGGGVLAGNASSFGARRRQGGEAGSAHGESAGGVHVETCMRACACALSERGDGREAQDETLNPCQHTCLNPNPKP